MLKSLPIQPKTSNILPKIRSKLANRSSLKMMMETSSPTSWLRTTAVEKVGISLLKYISFRRSG